MSNELRQHYVIITTTKQRLIEKFLRMAPFSMTPSQNATVNILAKVLNCVTAQKISAHYFCLFFAALSDGVDSTGPFMGIMNAPLLIPSSFNCFVLLSNTWVFIGFQGNVRFQKINDSMSDNVVMEHSWIFL